ncbi:MAG TPA: Scr1 family TA system antitoxin-like transcriptional regulator, partial [Actinoallomurus sp.]|nr:Scr1 family TA system antitoxin-like transcriptional regulator [Actinoallomurus sp.]
ARLGHDPNWIKQHVVDWPMGGREVMRKPLVDLLEVSERPNIGIRVIPRSAGDVAYTESPGGRLVSSAREVQSHVARYDRIGQKALPEDLSRQLIARVMETMK